jgi:hypothetical protein
MVMDSAQSTITVQLWQADAVKDDTATQRLPSQPAV